jgi:hypothetical protein
MNVNNAVIPWTGLSTAVRTATRSLAQDAGTIAPGPESSVGDLGGRNLGEKRSNCRNH